ncbi:unnamed protein product, partial [Discosporangium mesarthrocarpum]
EEGGGDSAWWDAVLTQHQPVALRTSSHFHTALGSGWYRLVVVLFHGRWTQESQHAVGIVRQLANQRAGITHPSLQGLSPEQGGIGTEVDDEVLLFEADVMSLIDVAERHTLTSLPSLHAFLGGREVLRRQVKEDDTPASLGKMIAGLTQRCTVKLGA